MSTTEVEVLNTKLDILIDDFKMLKKVAIGFVVVAVLPFSAYILLTVVENAQEIAIVKATLGY